MFIKKDNASTIAEVITRNTGIEAKEFIKEEKNLYIYNLKETAKFIKWYIEKHKDEQVSIVGDFDSDGINATAILYWAFRVLGVKANIRLPHRFSEGFGLNVKIIDEIPERSLLITVDNGIAAVDAIKKAKEKKMAVVVIDHHLAPLDDNNEQILPLADYIIDPAIETKSEFHNYCGAALAYRLAKEMLPDKHLRELEVLASIATVTDVMPLIRENRAIVKEGLSYINQEYFLPGLKSLILSLNLNNPITEDAYGFNIGPCFNASGRLFDTGAEEVLSLLISNKIDFITQRKAEAIIQRNELRKQIVRDEMLIIEKKVGEIYPIISPIVVFDERFHEGIVGILAGNLKEKYNCPSIVFTKSHEKGILKGSGRSIEGYNLKQILDKVAEKGLLYKYGGHAGAAGLSILEKDLDEFTKTFIEAVGELPQKSEYIYYDLDIEYEDIPKILEELSIYAPYGEGNAKPIFHMSYNSDGEGKVIGDGTHFMIKDDNLTIMGFGMTDKWQDLGCPTYLDMVGYISESQWCGKTSIKFEIVDFEKYNK